MESFNSFQFDGNPQLLALPTSHLESRRELIGWAKFIGTEDVNNARAIWQARLVAIPSYDDDDNVKFSFFPIFHVVHDIYTILT